MRAAHPEERVEQRPTRRLEASHALRGLCPTRSYTSNFTPWASGSWLLQLMVQVCRRM
jgi:hypothetical protein